MSVPFSSCIDARTRYCAVFGHPVRHSASPAMQNAGMASLGLNWRYLAFEVLPNDLRQAIDGAKRMGFIGLNLTVPHKVAGLACVDTLDDRARLLGAINTIRFEGRSGAGDWKPLGEFEGPPDEIRSRGFNTDAEAIVRVIRQDLGLELKDARVLLLGAGGAGRVAALRLAEENPSELFLVNRTISKAEELMTEISERFHMVRTTAGYPDGTVDLVVNTTSLGLKKDDPLPFDSRTFSLNQAACVFDMVYHPQETPLVANATAAARKVADGLGMLLYQGAAALELWTGRPAPVETMKQALHAAMKDRRE